MVVLRRELEFLKDEVSPGPGDSAAVGSVLGLLLRQLADFDFHDHKIEHADRCFGISSAIVA